MALVLGAGGFIGSHMVSRLVNDGFYVVGVDLKKPEFSESGAHKFILGDLRDRLFVDSVVDDFDAGAFDEIYQFAADMGGAGFVFTGEHDADIMHNSATINLNVLDSLRQQKARIGDDFHTKIFYSGSACMYPEHNQMDPDNPNLEESSAYPANPDSEYGWEKLFSERLYLAYERNYGIKVAVARYHNIYGPEGTWQGGREKAPAAICRKVASIEGDKGEIEVWGDGNQTRSFLYIDDCIEATRRLMNSDFPGPINIGSEEMVTINGLVKIAADVGGKEVSIRHKLDGPTGVRGRNSDNKLIRAVLSWDYEVNLQDGVSRTYKWIKSQMNPS
jgi:nucleoside-diphosphate-sugar epimerase